MTRRPKIRKNYTLDEEAVRLLDEYIPRNHSKFISNLIIDNLGKRKGILAKAIEKINEGREMAQRVNYSVDIDKDDQNKEIRVHIKEENPKKFTEIRDKLIETGEKESEKKTEIKEKTCV